MDPNEGQCSSASVSPGPLQSLDSKPQQQQLPQHVEHKEVEDITVGLGSMILAPSKGEGDRRARRGKGEIVGASRTGPRDRRRSDGGTTLLAVSARRRSLTPSSAQQQSILPGDLGTSASCDNIRPPWKIAESGSGSGSSSPEYMDDSFKYVNRGLEKPRDREKSLGDRMGGRQGENPFEQGVFNVRDEKMMAGYSPASLVKELEEDSAPFEGFRRAASQESSSKSQSCDAPENWSADGPPSTLSRSSSHRLPNDRTSLDGTFSRSSSYRQRLAREEQDIVTPLSPPFKRAPRFEIEEMATRQGNFSRIITSPFPSLQEFPGEFPGLSEQRDVNVGKRAAWREHQGKNSFSISYHGGVTEQGGGHQQACDGWAGDNDDPFVSKSMSFDQNHKPRHGFFGGLSMALRTRLMSAFARRSERRDSRSSNHASRSSMESASAHSKYDPSNSHASRSQSPVRNNMAKELRKRSQSPNGRYSARKGRSPRPMSKLSDTGAESWHTMPFPRWALMRSASNASSSSGKNSSRDMNSSIDEALGDGSFNNTAVSGAYGTRRPSSTGTGCAGNKSLSATGSFIQRVLTTLHGPEHKGGRSALLRARWVYATWWAAQEAQRQKEASCASTDGVAHLQTVGQLSPPLHVRIWRSWLARIAPFLCSLYAVLGLDVYYSCQAPKSADAFALGAHTACWLVLFSEFFARIMTDRSSYVNTLSFWMDLGTLAGLIFEVLWLLASVAVFDRMALLTILGGGKALSIANKAARFVYIWQLQRRISSYGGGETVEAIKRKASSAWVNAKSFASPANKASSSPVHASACSSEEEDQEESSGREDRNNLGPERKTIQRHDIMSGKGMVGARMDSLLSFHLMLAYAGMFAIIIALTSFRDVAWIESGGPESGLGMLEAALKGGGKSALDGVLEAFVVGMQASTPVLSLQVQGVQMMGSIKASRPADDLRLFPLESQAFCIGGKDDTCVLVDLREWVRSQSQLTLVLNIVIVFMMSCNYLCLYQRIFREIVVPLERMALFVKHVRRKPLDQMTALEPQLHEGLPKEVRSLEVAMRGLHQLIQVSFGEAGSKIISEHMRKADAEGSACVNLTPRANTGKHVQAIFGFCDIRNFTDCTEVLQGGVVTLVNLVADIVHEAVVDGHGAPNKNIGDAFLLVWKPKGQVGINRVADSALRSYVRTIMLMERSAELERIASMASMQEKVPGYHVTMGFGLHFGWAIEGAIGSRRKIDASYLSPHVNMASRLEDATKAYGCKILMSGDVHVLLSPNVQKLCRKVDRVVLKGVGKPIDLWTYDVPTGKNVPLPPAAMDSSTFFNMLQPHTSQKFRDNFDAAVCLYLGGDDGSEANWIMARKLLQKCLVVDPSDGPARVLLLYITNNSEDGMAPKSWKGYRTMTSK